MPSFLKVLLQGLFVKFMREKIRQGSLQAVRIYVGLVQQTRLLSMAAVGVTTTAASVLVGFSFVVGSIIWLLPISRDIVPYVFMGFGFVMVLLGSISLRTFFKEEHWMEMSEAYTLIDKVTNMGKPEQETADSHVDTKFAHIAKQAAQKMRDEASRKPFPPQRERARQTRLEPQEV